ncbi:hypothetical protein C345_04445 [Cryptococcus neoformans A2-102-5]|nr:hypothetical protein C346_04558 [Cryptococcus neoformans var. grubii D17-1]OXG94191.1 hypothetical protein C345_04445 [Cryptococcus neoformans var. grubii A2-102-5]
MASGSTVRPRQGEVIQEFLDGGSYIRDSLRDAVTELDERRNTKEEGQKAAKAMEALDVSKAEGLNAQDVEFIAQQTGLDKKDAEEVLRAEKGDLIKALLKSVQPRRRANSLNGDAIPK